jgi:MFS family permease
VGDTDQGTSGWAAVREGFGALRHSDWMLLLLLGSTMFFDGYDRGVILVALKQIRGSFDLSQTQASWYLAVLYLGALPAVPLTLRADRVGRKRLLVLSVLGYTIATGVTAIAPNAATFSACQFVARMFLNAEAAIVWTLAAETLPARARGIGFGWLQMSNALGVGFGAIAFGGVIQPLGLSWRWLYVVGIPPLLLVARLRRRLPESERFESLQRTGGIERDWRAVFRPPRRRWILFVIAGGVLLNLSQQASSFAVDFLQTQRHLGATQASFMLVAAGLPGIPFMVLAGALSDRYGRRVVGCSLAGLGVVGALCFFWMPGGAWVLWPCMVVMLLGVLGAGPVLGAYTAELFDTSVRGQAVSWATVANVGGQAGSLALGGLLLGAFGSLSIAVTLLGIGPVIGLMMIWRYYPDTHGRELEDVHPDPAPQPPSGVAAADRLPT